MLFTITIASVVFQASLVRDASAFAPQVQTNYVSATSDDRCATTTSSSLFMAKSGDGNVKEDEDFDEDDIDLSDKD